MFCFLFMIFHFASSQAQQQIKYQYYGGHGCIALDLDLYTDSTFLFVTSNAMPFPHSSKKKGAYLLYEDEIRLYEKKRLHFLIPKLELKYRETVFKRDAEHIYLFDKNKIPKDDNGFTETYYTLHVAKRN